MSKFWTKLFEAEDPEVSAAQVKTEVQKAPARKKLKDIDYVDIEDLGDSIRVTVVVVGCESADFDCIGRPSTSDPSFTVADEMRIERKAKKADKNGKYLHRGIMPKDTLDVISLGCQVKAENDLQLRAENLGNGVITFKLTKVAPTGKASFDFT